MGKSAMRIPTSTRYRTRSLSSQQDTELFVIVLSPYHLYCEMRALTFLPVYYYSKTISAGKDIGRRKCTLHYKQKIELVDELTKLKKSGAHIRFQHVETAQQWFSKCFSSDRLHLPLLQTHALRRGLISPKHEVTVTAVQLYRTTNRQKLCFIHTLLAFKVWLSKPDTKPLLLSQYRSLTVPILRLSRLRLAIKQCRKVMSRPSLETLNFFVVLAKWTS